MLYCFDYNCPDEFKNLVSVMYLSGGLKRTATFAGGIIRRNLCQTSTRLSSKAYDYDGKTKIDIFNTQQDLGIMITGYSQFGFRMNNDMVVIGPVAVFPRYCPDKKLCIDLYLPHISTIWFKGLFCRGT